MLGLSYPFVLQGERARWATPHGCSHNHRPGARATITRQPPLLLNKMPRCPHARICTNTLALLWLRGLYRKHLVVTANTHFRGKLARTANPVSHGKCLFSWQAHLDHKCWFQPQIAILWPAHGILVVVKVICFSRWLLSLFDDSSLSFKRTAITYTGVRFVAAPIAPLQGPPDASPNYPAMGTTVTRSPAQRCTA